MGMLHAGIMNGLNGVELCGISDSSKFLLGFAKALKGIPVYTDYLKMLDNEKPDAVAISTPVFLHVPMARECVQRNLPFFLEKPLSTNSQEAASLVQSIGERKLVTMVGYMMRYVATFARAKQILDSGVLGKVITFNSTIYVAQLFKRGKGWRYSKKEAGGGVVMAQASHLIDLLQWFFGEVDSVSAHVKNWYSKEVEDFAHAYFRFSGGVEGWLDSTWSMRHHRLLETSIRINAENGNLEVTDDDVRLFLDTPAGDYPAGWTVLTQPDLFEGVDIDLGGPQYSRQDKAFVDAVQKGQPLQSDVRNAYVVQRLVDAIYASAEKQGMPVRIQ